MTHPQPRQLVRYEHIPEADLLERLKRTRLQGHGQPLIYESATLEYLRIDPNLLRPAQHYVLTEDVQTILHLHDAFQHHGVDIFSLRGGLHFWLQGEGEDDLEGPIPLIPPIIEESLEPDGTTTLLICDGMHRVYAARLRGALINVIVARGVPRQYPYYAFAVPGGWDAVQYLTHFPEGFVKKRYRDEQHYKALFRDFNAILPGVQKQRKQTNPRHLTP